VAFAASTDDGIGIADDAESVELVDELDSPATSGESRKSMSIFLGDGDIFAGTSTAATYCPKLEPTKSSVQRCMRSGSTVSDESVRHDVTLYLDPLPSRVVSCQLRRAWSRQERGTTFEECSYVENVPVRRVWRTGIGHNLSFCLGDGSIECWFYAGLSCRPAARANLRRGVAILVAAGRGAQGRGAWVVEGLAPNVVPRYLLLKQTAKLE
jgi:hypothetical protein